MSRRKRIFPSSLKKQIHAAWLDFSMPARQVAMTCNISRTALFALAQQEGWGRRRRGRQIEWPRKPRQRITKKDILAFNALLATLAIHPEAT